MKQADLWRTGREDGEECRGLEPSTRGSAVPALLFFRGGLFSVILSKLSPNLWCAPCISVSSNSSITPHKREGNCRPHVSGPFNRSPKRRPSDGG